MRRILCLDSVTGLEEINCDKTMKPIDYQLCNEGPCPQWNHGPWSDVRHANSHSEEGGVEYCFPFVK